MRDDFLPAVQWHVTRLSIIASAARGQRAPGLVAAARSFLAVTPLQPFGTASRRAFRARLDATTDELRRELPRGARTWGISRKLLNIFLRNALYNGYLNAAFKLDRAERWFEVPLDSIVAVELRTRLGRGELSRWKGVKYVTPSQSDEYQMAIRELAALDGLAPVHLDTYWWGGARPLARSPTGR